MTTIHNDPVPAERIRQFHEILCATGGRYLRNPHKVGSVVLCDYAPGDYKAQCEAWNRITTPIKEVRKDQWWRKLARRLVN